MKIQGTSQWRWLLVLPAFLLGYLVPSSLINILWEMRSSLIPGVDFPMMRVVEILPSIVSGVCAVVFAGYVAPRKSRVVRLVAATVIVVVVGGLSIYGLLTDFFQGMPTLEVIWVIVLRVTQILAAIAAGLVRHTPPATEYSQ